MQMEFSTKEDLGLVELSGDLNVVRVDPFRQQFKEWFLANPNVKHVIIDFQNVGMIDSAGLGSLVALLKQIAERGGSLRLAGLRKRVRLVFEITRTHRIFDMYDSVDKALGAIG
jgi:anti-sigma B factor antagonist